MPRASLLGGFVRNVLLQIRFKCIAFAQKCRDNAGNAISETNFNYVYPAWGRHIRVSPRVVNRLHRPVLIVNTPIVISSKRQVLPLFDPYAKVTKNTRKMPFLRDFLFSFVCKFWNKHPPVEMPSVRHCLSGFQTMYTSIDYGCK